MKLSKRAWDHSHHCIESIKRHPFNVELKNGTLPLETFGFYIEQDTLYLQDFAKCFAIIASKVPKEHMRSFLRFAEYALIAEQEVVHDFFRKTYQFKETKKITLATLSYTNYLLSLSALESVEVAIAGVLPCFWVYREVGLDIAKDAKANNPYSRWIETYSGKDFANSVNELIDIFDALQANTSEAIRLKMLDAFYKSCCLEWHFWNDAYHKYHFDASIM